MPGKYKNTFQEPVVIVFEQASAAADRTDRLFKVPAGKKLRVDAVQYFSSTGLAGNDTNFFNIKLLKGATIAFNWSTAITGGQGTLTADTFHDLVASATDADKVFAAGDVMSMFDDLTGTATLPAGKLVVHGRYV